MGYVETQRGFILSALTHTRPKKRPPFGAAQV